VLPQSGMLAIETHGLTRYFGERAAVADLSLAVPEGAFYGFLGPNGAGKSTTMKLLTGLLAPSSGGARILGVDLAKEPLVVKRQIGVLPDGLALFERLSGAEQLRLQGQLYGLAREEAGRRADELLQALDLVADAGKLIVDYSHGMKKKLALGCALIHAPRLLFLDEPFEGIDAVAVTGIRRMLQDLVTRGHMTIFLTSHVLEVVERLVTHVGIIREGKLVQQGTLDEVRGTSTLEEVFIRTVGEDQIAPLGLSWLGDRPSEGEGAG
jgi:ABC-2 type transport system ATP-binding protein